MLPTSEVCELGGSIGGSALLIVLENVHLPHVLAEDLPAVVVMGRAFIGPVVLHHKCLEHTLMGQIMPISSQQLLL